MFSLVVFAVCVGFAARSAHAAEGFITTWQTDNPGVSDDNQITIPTNGGGPSFNYTVDWGDGSTSTGLTTDATHTYADPGTYQVTITGSFPYITFAFGGDAQKLLSIDQWGDNVWTSFDSAFAGCTNLTITATDAPNLSASPDLTYMFRLSGLTNEDLNNWDVSRIYNTIGMFQDTPFNGNITGWDTYHFTNISAMFIADTAFNQDISEWDTDTVVNMNGLFSGATSFAQDLSKWRIGNVTDMGDMFTNVDMGAENYDALLASWSQQSVQSGLTFNGGLSAYCDAEARAILTSTPHNWTITDGGNYCLSTVTALPSRSTIQDAVYTFSVSAAVDAAFEAEDGAYVSDEPDCAACDVVIDPVGHTLTFNGLQNGDVLDFYFTFATDDTETNALHVGPTTIGTSSSGGGRRSRTSFQPTLVDVQEPPTTGISPFDGSVEDLTPVEPGMFVRGEHYDTVYYLDDALLRHPLWNAQVYFTWQDSFDTIMWVTDATLPTLTLGDPLLPKAGTVLVKLESDQRVYAIGAGVPSPLRLIADEQIAINTFGNDWADYVIDVAPTLFEHFTSGEQITLGESIDKTQMRKRMTLTERSS